MAINPNSARNAKHASVCMITGGGKGIAVNSLGLIGDEYPAVIFDPHGEYKRLGSRRVYAYKTKMNFSKQFARAWASGKPFVMAYTPKITGKDQKESKAKLQAAAEWFAKLVWAAGDGNRILYSVFEEYGEYCEGNGDDKTTIGKIFTGGRKFGIRAIAVFQRSATVSKTIWGNSPIKVIGAQGYEADIARVADALGCSRADVVDLGYRNKELEMYYSKIDENVRTKVHYLYSQAFGTCEKVACYVKPAASLRKNWSNHQKALDEDGGYRLAR
ncbi:hypothetical protein [Pseudoteredinibacter isoporae]|uniref:hypothetical protein n=1 Tax=Pseudoteredinibacter isoporae TaxID=570281 RepID=UPI003103FCA5